MHANCFYSLVFFCAKTYHKIYLCKFWLKTENMRNFLPEQCKMPKVKLCKFGYNMVSLKSLIICVLVCLLSLLSVFYNVLLVKNQQGCLWLVSWFFFFFFRVIQKLFTKWTYNMCLIHLGVYNSYSTVPGTKSSIKPSF